MVLVSGVILFGAVGLGVAIGGGILIDPVVANDDIGSNESDEIPEADGVEEALTEASDAADIDEESASDETVNDSDQRDESRNEEAASAEVAGGDGDGGSAEEHSEDEEPPTTEESATTDTDTEAAPDESTERSSEESASSVDPNESENTTGSPVDEALEDGVAEEIGSLTDSDESDPGDHESASDVPNESDDSEAPTPDDHDEATQSEDEALVNLDSANGTDARGGADEVVEDATTVTDPDRTLDNETESPEEDENGSETGEGIENVSGDLQDAVALEDSNDETTHETVNDTVDPHVSTDRLPGNVSGDGVEATGNDGANETVRSGLEEPLSNLTTGTDPANETTRLDLVDDATGLPANDSEIGAVDALLSDTNETSDTEAMLDANRTLEETPLALNGSLDGSDSEAIGQQVPLSSDEDLTIDGAIEEPIVRLNRTTTNVSGLVSGNTETMDGEELLVGGDSILAGALLEDVEHRLQRTSETVTYVVVTGDDGLTYVLETGDDLDRVIEETMRLESLAINILEDTIGETDVLDRSPLTDPITSEVELGEPTKGDQLPEQPVAIETRSSGETTGHLDVAVHESATRSDDVGPEQAKTLSSLTHTSDVETRPETADRTGSVDAGRTASRSAPAGAPPEGGSESTDGSRLTVPVLGPTRLRETAMLGTLGIAASVAGYTAGTKASTIGASLGSLKISSWVGQISLPRLPLFPGYNRGDDTDPLAHDLRESIHETVQAQPGIHLSGLVDELDVSRSTLRYHVRILEYEHMVHPAKQRGRRCLYPVGCEDAPDPGAAIGGPARDVLDTIERLDQPSVSCIAEELDRDVSTVSYHLDRLDEDGLIERRNDGSTVTSTLAPAARTMLVDRPSAGSGVEIELSD